MQLSKTYRLLLGESQLSIENKSLLYKAILKAVWALMLSNCGAQPPTQTWKYYKEISRQIPRNHYQRILVRQQ